MDNLRIDEYKERLRNFNSTEKYNRELRMLFNLVSPNPNEKIVDVGCGIGTAVKQFQFIFPRAIWIGYDVNPYSELAINEIPKGIDKAYFMHSFSHIQNISEFLNEIHSKLNKDGEIIIITPNPEWLWKHNDENHRKDLTVISHYSISELKKLIEPLFSIELIGQFDSELKKVGNLAFNGSEINERIFVKAIKK